MPVPNQTPANTASDYATTAFIVQQLMNGQATAALVRVMKCTNDGGLAAVGRVDVNLLVDIVAGDGTTFPHGTIFNAPYTRLQGGTNAVILDPEPGDLGVCVFCSRDISAVKSDPDAARNRRPSPGASPGSRRTFSLSDAVYLGGVLNAEPVQWVQFNTDGIAVHSPTLVRITAPTIELVADVVVTLQAPTINLKGSVVQTDGDVTMSQDLDVAGTITGDVDVIAGTISGKTHTHTSESPGDPTSPPIP